MKLGSWCSAAVVVLLGVCAPALVAQTAIGNVGGRQTTDLDGRWQAIVDPFDTGAVDYRAKPLKGNGAFFTNHKPQNPSELVEYDFDKSQQLHVPGDWNSQRDSLLFYEGSVWYEKSFDYQPKPGTRVFVHFGAANYIAEVALNGELLGRHEGGFTPFDFELTGKLKPKGNFLVVRVNNRRAKEYVPTLYTDWWNYGGLTRPVTLVEVPETFVENYFVQLAKANTGRIAGWVQLNGPRTRQKVTLRIPEANIAQSIETDATGRATFDFPANPSLWSPENPKLYDVELAAETDIVREKIGFRTIETRGTEILLNGKPLFLRGISIHEEAPLRPGRAWATEDAQTLLGWAKELGCNFVRLAHYPHNEAMLREADRLGLLVWAEVPVYWTIEWENPATLANAKNQLREMIARDHNRAAIILYSVANETPIGEPRTAFLRSLIAEARAEDPTRLLTAALQAREEDSAGGITIILDDPIGEYLDVLGNNEYIGWYVRKPEDADAIRWSTKYDKPLIMSEFGGDALYGLHGAASERWTEEYQENLYRHQLAMLKQIGFLRGTTPWILMDFRSPRRTLPQIEEYYNRKGLLTKYGEKKKAYFVLQEFYREKGAPAN